MAFWVGDEPEKRILLWSKHPCIGLTDVFLNLKQKWRRHMFGRFGTMVKVHG